MPRLLTLRSSWALSGSKAKVGRRRLLRWVTSLACAPLVGCASLSGPLTGEDPPRTGRMAVRVDADGSLPSKQLSAAYELRGTEEKGRLQLLSPLGTVVAEAVWEPDRAILRTGSEDDLAYGSLAELASALFGTDLPMAAVFTWMRGQAWAGATAQATDTGFTQLGWAVDTSAFEKEGLLIAQRPAPPKVSLRLRVDR
jgi:outer membrane lipoprotein LolB